MIPTARAQLASIQQASAKLAVDLPAAFTAALAAARQLVEQTEALEGHTERFNTAVIDALLNNGDPAKDTEVRKLAVLRVIGTSGIREAGSQRAGEMIEQAVTEHGDELIDSWAASVQTDCDTLSSSADELSDIADLRRVDVADLERTKRLPVWSSAVSAFYRVDAASAGQRAVFTALGVQHQCEHRVLAFTDDLDVALSVNSVIVGSAAPDAWTVASVAALSLANVTQFTQRVGLYVAEMRRRRLEEEAARTPTGFDGARRQAVAP